MIIVETIAVGLLICSSVLVIVNRHLLHSRVTYRLSWNQFIRLLLIFSIGAHIHIVIYIFLIIFWESFFTDHMIILILWIIFKECLWSRRLRLVVAHITTMLITFEVLLSHVLTLLQTFLVNLDTCSHNSTTLSIMHLVVYCVSIWYILSMDTAASLYHWQLLCIKIFIGIWCETPNWLFLYLSFILTPCCQIRQFLLSFT